MRFSILEYLDLNTSVILTALFGVVGGYRFGQAIADTGDARRVDTIFDNIIFGRDGARLAKFFIVCRGAHIIRVAANLYADFRIFLHQLDDAPELDERLLFQNVRVGVEKYIAQRNFLTYSDWRQRHIENYRLRWVGYVGRREVLREK